MATSVIMPKAGMAMEEGIILSWLKKPGDAVKAGEAIAEIETDKAAMELEAEVDGILLAILHAPGDHVPVTEVIAWIGKEGETLGGAGTTVPPALPSRDQQGKLLSPVSALSDKRPSESLKADTIRPDALSADTSSVSRTVAATPAARREAKDAGIPLEQIQARDGIRYKADVVRHIRAEGTPLASRLAEKWDIDLVTLYKEKGSRVTKDDVLAHKAGQAEGATRKVPLTKIQRITGERLSRTHAEIPPVTIFMAADITELLVLRTKINTDPDCTVSITDFTVRAAIKALSENPRVNAVLDGDSLIEIGTINLGLAVATNDGLLVPVLRDAAKLGLMEASKRSRDLAERARVRKLRPEELEGGTFTVTNVGMLGVTYFTPLINQPQVGILGIGAVESRLVRGKDGAIEDASFIHLSFTFDHRALDGAESAAFLKSVQNLLENPVRLIL
jgi:pyruvate dehydrogenase E2 component (dihydrolipoamide acetyltransferase)